MQKQRNLTEDDGLAIYDRIEALNQVGGNASIAKELLTMMLTELPEQSLELYTALRIQQVPTQLVFYPREPHGLNERAHQLDFVRRVLDWFDRHLAAAGR